MFCHECKQAAVGVCRSCGLAFCGGHGADYCKVCAVGIVPAGATGPRRVQTAFLQCENRPRMPTVYLDDEDPGPPSCYRCEGLARTVCEHCDQLYCAEHAGRRGWCDLCTRQAWASLKLTLGVLACIVAVFVVMFLLSLLPRK